MLNEQQSELVIDWMAKSPAPEELIASLACNCTRKCVASHCSRVDNGLWCSELCKLKSCENQPDDDDIDPEILIGDQDDIYDSD